MAFLYRNINSRSVEKKETVHKIRKRIAMFVGCWSPKCGFFAETCKNNNRQERIERIKIYTQHEIEEDIFYINSRPTLAYFQLFNF